MTRSIDLHYQDSPSDEGTRIEIKSPYHLFGSQRFSYQFWSLPIWNEIGVTILSELGDSDPIWFQGWEMMEDLKKEIDLFQNNIERIDFDVETKCEWLAHLTYCYNLIIMRTPKDKMPLFTIG